MLFIRLSVLGLFVCFRVLGGGTAYSQEQPTFSQGPAQIVHSGLIKCTDRGARVSALGMVTAMDGSKWIVPAPVHYSKHLFANDLYNDCSGNRPNSPKDLDLTAIPLRTEADGKDVYSAYIFADNYFEFYVSGKLIAIDPVPFTPFNSNIIRFTAERPFTVAAMLVDWEETLGIGTEANRGASHHPGDGGLVAVIKDAQGKTVAITDNRWRAQTFYIAPLENQDCLKIHNGMRDSRDCSSPTRQSTEGLMAAHWKIPTNWMVESFDDSAWPQATAFSNDTVGVDNKRSYMNFTAIFDDQQEDAKFIWSPNLVLDNLVLVRKTIR